MNILYVHQYFKTPEEGGSIRSYYLAKGLVDHGHKVTLITAHNIKRGHVHVDGIDVHYLKVPYANEYGFIRRIFAFLKFVWFAKRKIAQLQKHQLAYVMTTPLTTGLIALHIKRKWKIPYYFEVGDLWPEAPIKMGAIKNRLLKRKLYQFEKKCYLEAQSVIALSPAIRNYVESVSPATKVHVLPNISNNSLFKPSYKLQEFSSENPLKVGYFGTFGIANELTFLVDAAQACMEQNLPVRFILMGEGATFKSIQSKSKDLTNVKVIPFGNVWEVKEQLEKQDAVYVSFKNIEVLNSGSPNKFFDGLAAGKLIIINFGGWIRDIVEKNGCGFYHDPFDPADFARKILIFLQGPKLLVKSQKQSRRLAEINYDRGLQVQKLLKVLLRGQPL